MALTVRPAGEADLEALVEGNLQLARETEGRELCPDTVRSGVRRLLAQPSRGFYLVAESEARVVGQLCVTFEWSDWRDGLFFWIQSVYVNADARRAGVYSALHGEVARMARERGDVVGLRLYVMQDNEAARATYESLRMQRTPYRLYEGAVGSEDTAKHQGD